MRIRFLCSTILKSSFDGGLQSQFERESGHTLDVSYGPSAQLAKRLIEGETADATVLTGNGFDEAAAAGKVDPASRVVLARSATMVAVKQGTPRPDISTVEKFKQAMLAAKSVVYSAPASGSTGTHMVKVIAQLGIGEVMKARTILGPGGPAGLVGNYLVRGDAELGIQQDSELMAIAGVDIVGPLPGELNLITEFVFGLPAGVSSAGAAATLGEFLRSPSARAMMQAKGLTPV